MASRLVESWRRTARERHRWFLEEIELEERELPGVETFRLSWLRLGEAWWDLILALLRVDPEGNGE